MRFFHVLPLVVICLVGCSSKPSIVGKWNMSGGTMPPGTKLVTEFKDTTFDVNAEATEAGMTLKFGFSGDYTYDGAKLKMTGKTVTLDDSTLPAMAKPMAKQIKEGIEKAVLTTEEGTAKLEGDVLTFVPASGKQSTFTRIK